MRCKVWFALVVGSSIAALAQEAASPAPDLNTPELSSTETEEAAVPSATGPMPGELALVPQTSASADPAYTPLTLKQKWLYSVSEIFGPARVAGYTMHTIFDYAFDLPKQWGREGDSLAMRAASHLGDNFLRYNIQFAIQAADHEDPRYFRSGQHGAWKRTKYAVLHTFVVRSDDQSWMPAYSLLASAYAVPYIRREWRPEAFHRMSGVEAGSSEIGITVGSNIFNEFWPDLKKKLSKAPFVRQSWLNYGIR